MVRSWSATLAKGVFLEQMKASLLLPKGSGETLQENLPNSFPTPLHVSNQTQPSGPAKESTHKDFWGQLIRTWSL
jgi:hypothetical protein